MDAVFVRALHYFFSPGRRVDSCRLCSKLAVHIVPQITVSFILAAIDPVQKAYIGFIRVSCLGEHRIGYEGQNMKALLGMSQHLVYSSFTLTITLSSFLDHDLTFVFLTCQAQVPPKDFEHYEGISSPTSTWSGLPISSISAGTFHPRPLKPPSLDDCHWTSSAHRQRQRPSGEVRY